MGLQNKHSIKHLTRILPEGVVAPSNWLTSNGYSRQLVRKYVISGWLKRVGHGAYARSGQTVGWEGVLLGLHRLAGRTCHIGGLSALERHGLAHFLPLGGEKKIHVMSNRKPPAWLKSIELTPELYFDTRRLFPDEVSDLGLVELPTEIRDWRVPLSGPERAILELLNDVGPNDHSFQHAAHVFEGMTVLRPGMVSDLLATCRSIKVRRIFLFLADHFHYPWVKRLQTAALNLGRGNRQVVKGGRLDKRYHITVPERFDAEPL